MRPLQHKCLTLRGDKDNKERRQTITCQKFHPNMGYLFHLMYAYITQRRPDRGLLRLTPRAQAIITQGIGVYAALLLQPTQITTEPPKGTPSTSITPRQLPAYPYPATPTSSTSLTHPAPSNAPPRSVASPYASPGARTSSTWNTTPEPPSLGRHPTTNCAPWRTPSPPHHHWQRSSPATSG